MSFVMAVFILVPIIAPALGQGILLIAGWRAIFGVFLTMGLVASAWFIIRQPETLPVEKRIPLSFTRVVNGFREVLTTRAALGYTITAGLVFGAFIGYLTTAQQVFQVQYELGNLFPLYFAMLSISIGVASLLNARLVMRWGMATLSQWALSVMALLSVGFFFVAYLEAGHPHLWVLMVYLLAVFFCEGILYGNLNALAMEPLGHIAGVGAAVVGALSMVVSLVGGTLIGQSYDGTVVPLVIGFGALAIASLAVMRWTQRLRATV
jgi:DHA1 family bicyclomycin/chloramphenicol resistance-like MFS transporter